MWQDPAASCAVTGNYWAGEVWGESWLWVRAVCAACKGLQQWNNQGCFESTGHSIFLLHLPSLLHVIITSREKTQWNFTDFSPVCLCLLPEADTQSCLCILWFWLSSFFSHLAPVQAFSFLKEADFIFLPLLRSSIILKSSLACFSLPICGVFLLLHISPTPLSSAMQTPPHLVPPKRPCNSNPCHTAKPLLLVIPGELSIPAVSQLHPPTSHSSLCEEGIFCLKVENEP